MSDKKFVHRLTQDELKQVVLHYEAALIRIRDQSASPSYGTPAYKNWLHWQTIAKNALEDGGSPTLKQSNILADEVERLRHILGRLAMKHPHDVAKELEENPGAEPEASH